MVGDGATPGADSAYQAKETLIQIRPGHFQQVSLTPITYIMSV